MWNGVSPFELLYSVKPKARDYDTELRSVQSRALREMELLAACALCMVRTDLQKDDVKKGVESKDLFRAEGLVLVIQAEASSTSKRPAFRPEVYSRCTDTQACHPFYKPVSGSAGFGTKQNTLAAFAHLSLRKSSFGDGDDALVHHSGVCSNAANSRREEEEKRNRVWSRFWGNVQDTRVERGRHWLSMSIRKEWMNVKEDNINE